MKTPKEVSLEIAARLKAKRLLQNLTQAGLATRAGMSTPQELCLGKHFFFGVTSVKT